MDELKAVDKAPADSDPTDPDAIPTHYLFTFLLQPVIHLLATIVAFAISNTFHKTLAQLTADNLHFLAFYCVAGVASIVVNVPLLLHLLSVRAGYRFDDVGPLDLVDSPCESQVACQKPKRITRTSEIRSIVLVGVVAGLWLLVVVIYFTLDDPSFVSELLDFGRVGKARLPLPEWITNRLQIGVSLRSYFTFPLSLCSPFLVQLLIWILCLLERYQFISFIDTKPAPVDEEEGKPLISV